MSLPAALLFLASALTAGAPSFGRQPPPAPRPPDDADEFVLEGGPEYEAVDITAELPTGRFRGRPEVRKFDGKNKPVAFLPVYLLRRVVVRRDAADGPMAVTVHLYDVGRNKALKDALDVELAARVKKREYKYVEPLDRAVGVQLLLEDNGHMRPLASGRFNLVPGRWEVRPIRFDLDAAAADLVVRANDPRKLLLKYTETYKAKFYRSDLEAALRDSHEQGADLKNLIAADHKGRRPALLVEFGGTLGQTQVVKQIWKRNVQMSIALRKGSENAALLQSIMDKLFETTKATDIRLSEQSKDTVVSFLFGNGVRATGTVSEFTQLTEQQKRDIIHDVDATTKEGGSDKRTNESNVTVERIGSGGSKASSETDRTKEKTLNEKNRDTEEFSKAIAGKLLVPSLNVAQVQSLAARAESKVSIDLSTFESGPKQLDGLLPFDSHPAAWGEGRLSPALPPGQKQNPAPALYYFEYRWEWQPVTRTQQELQRFCNRAQLETPPRCKVGWASSFYHESQVLRDQPEILNCDLDRAAEATRRTRYHLLRPPPPPILLYDFSFVNEAVGAIKILPDELQAMKIDDARRMQSLFKYRVWPNPLASETDFGVGNLGLEKFIPDEHSDPRIDVFDRFWRVSGEH